MTTPSIQGASGIEGEKLTYASTNENNKKIYTFTNAKRVPAKELETFSEVAS